MDSTEGHGFGPIPYSHIEDLIGKGVPRYAGNARQGEHGENAPGQTARMIVAYDWECGCRSKRSGGFAQMWFPCAEDLERASREVGPG